ncbi:unnamed protein product [Dicrocoelium dendriticum]|nr:unnamed protein product [Dicrocoelium dendriticum]
MPLFGSSCDYSKLKSNLRLCCNRMGLLQKKKTELGLKARKEIAELLRVHKIERSRIKTEQIVREDYVIEVMEILQTYCDLLLTRFGIFEASREVDAGLEEAIATLIWCCPRLSAEVNELNVIKQLFATKYSKEYVAACAENRLKKVNPTVMKKLDLLAPSPALIEMYMMEIAKTYDVDYEPTMEFLNPNIGHGADGGGNIEQQLINFEPESAGGLPKLPDGYCPPEQRWMHTPESGPGAPYPSSNPFPVPDENPPPIPSDPPVATGPVGYYGYNQVSPPSYDSAVFPDKRDSEACGNSGFDEPRIPPAASVPTSQDNDFPCPPEDVPPGHNVEGAGRGNLSSDDQDFDELQRRFHALTNPK